MASQCWSWGSWEVYGDKCGSWGNLLMSPGTNQLWLVVVSPTKGEEMPPFVSQSCCLFLDRAWAPSPRAKALLTQSQGQHWGHDLHGQSHGHGDLHVSSPLRIICCCSVWLTEQQCLTLCHLMNCSSPGSAGFHYLLEFAQTYVHWVTDAINSRNVAAGRNLGDLWASLTICKIGLPFTLASGLLWSRNTTDHNDAEADALWTLWMWGGCHDTWSPPPPSEVYTETSYSDDPVHGTFSLHFWRLPSRPELHVFQSYQDALSFQFMSRELKILLTGMSRAGFGWMQRHGFCPLSQQGLSFCSVLG